MSKRSSRLAKELMVAGLAVLLLAAALVALSCTVGGNDARAGLQGLVRAICPPANRNVVPAPGGWGALTGIIFLIVLGIACLIVGAILTFRPARSAEDDQVEINRHQPTTAVEAPPAASFGRCEKRTPRRSAEPSQAWSLMDTIRNQVELGQLDTALEMAGRAIVESGNPRLIKALNDSRPLDCDWTQVVAAAIEADFDAKAAGREGCRDILLQLSAFPEDRTVFTSGFFGPRPPQSDSDRLEHGQRAPSRVGRSEAIDVPGLAALAALESDAGLSGQQRIEQERLAGTLLVLRFLETIRRYAADMGFPFPVTLRAGVESVGGEDAIRQLSPRLHIGLAEPGRADWRRRRATARRSLRPAWRSLADRLPGSGGRAP
ncbi:hypothetical protein H9L13_05225 [Sphingomonas lutea]|uniref:Uncharacterized protein n=1 Tax=Sphingomonas lutea TaxID=1045317 RepID=A0A7G9SKA1_9SPHN|nr:hypothetical protein [Sphingomonas lutea]QNN68276.1 hypothetical protein H9L13_05225 [Sphingomonas lutea]